MTRERFSFYQISIHAMLFITSILIVALARENVDLKAQLTPIEAIMTGERAEPISIRNLDGGDAVLSFAEAEKDSLLLVFTTTCPACRQNQAAWRTLYENNKDRFRIIGIGLEDMGVTAAYQEAQELPFPVVLPSDYDRFAKEYGIVQIPFTVHIGRGGKVVDSWIGVLPEETVSEISSLTVTASLR